MRQSKLLNASNEILVEPPVSPSSIISFHPIAGCQVDGLWMIPYRGEARRALSMLSKAFF
jgi:hypothetical protein